MYLVPILIFNILVALAGYLTGPPRARIVFSHFFNLESLYVSLLQVQKMDRGPAMCSCLLSSESCSGSSPLVFQAVESYKNA